VLSPAEIRNAYKIRIIDRSQGGGSMGTVTDQEIDQVMGKASSDKSLFAKMATTKELMNRTRINSTNMLPSLVTFNQTQRAALIGEQATKTRRGTLEFTQDQDLLNAHQKMTRKESENMRVVKRKYSELLFKQALETL